MYGLLVEWDLWNLITVYCNMSRASYHSFESIFILGGWDDEYVLGERFAWTHRFKFGTWRLIIEMDREEVQREPAGVTCLA